MDTFNQHLHSATLSLATSFKKNNDILPPFAKCKTFQQNYILLSAFEKWRLELCAEIMRKLPQELRDMVSKLPIPSSALLFILHPQIYIAVLSNDRTIRIFTDPSSRTVGRFRFMVEPLCPFSYDAFEEDGRIRRETCTLPGEIIPLLGDGKMQLFSTGITDSQFARELTSTFCETAVFNVVHAHLVSRVVQSHLFAGSSAPGATRHLRISLWGRLEEGDEPVLAACLDEYLLSQVQELDCLRHLPTTAKVHIHIAFMYDSFPGFKSLLQMLAPLLFALKKQGRKVTLTRWAKCVWNTLSRAPRLCRRDSTHVLEENTLKGLMRILVRAKSYVSYT